MPIPCGACQQPVHAQAVVCPHCGGRTGVAPSQPTPAEAAELAAAVLAETHMGPRPVPAGRLDVALIVRGIELVGDAIARVANEPIHAEPALPKAVARRRRRQT